MPWLRKSWDFLSVVGQFTTKGCLRCDSDCPCYASLGFLLCSRSSLRPKAACAALVNVLVTQVWDLLSVVGHFTTKSCMRCDSDCPGYASLGFLLCSRSSLRRKAARAAIMNALVTQVWDFLSIVGQFTTKGCPALRQ